jgi:hypothetical protein
MFRKNILPPASWYIHSFHRLLGYDTVQSGRLLLIFRYYFHFQGRFVAFTAVTFLLRSLAYGEHSRETFSVAAVLLRNVGR